MAQRIRHLILVLLIAGGVCSPRAQTAPAAVPVVRQVTLEFTVSCRQTPQGLLYRPGKGQPLQPVKFLSGYRGLPLGYKGPETLEFFDAAALDAESPRPVAVCRVPEGMTKALLLFLPRFDAGADGIRYDVAPINDSMDRMPPNSFAVINVTGKDYMAQFGSSAPFAIARGVSNPYRASGQVMFQLATSFNGKWITAGRRRLDLSKQNRVWVILYPPRREHDVGPQIDTLTQELVRPPAGSTPVAVVR